MSCEICGRLIRGEPKRVVIDGVKMIVCYSCAPMGSSYWEPLSVSKEKFKPRKKSVNKSRTIKPKPNNWIETMEPVESVSSLVKKTRIKLGLTQEELAKISKEKLSMIQKIESGKIAPSVPLCRTLQHILKINLLTEAENEEPSVSFDDQKTELTIGDIAHFKDKNRRIS